MISLATATERRICRVAPQRNKKAFPGALAAALLWLAGSAALSWYLANFGNYTATYGSLGDRRIWGGKATGAVT
jgi:uncharacterized BrkB/YihY/UPF0761 family membrane protein